MITPRFSLYIGVILTFSALLFQKIEAVEYIKNGDFKQGRSGWSQEGRVIFLNAAEEELNQEEEGTTPILKVSLTRKEWSNLECKIKTPEGIGAVPINVELKPSKDYARSPEINQLTDLDWPAGKGGWIWSGIAKVRNDLTVMIQSNTNFFNVQTKNFSEIDWHTLRYNINSLGEKKMERIVILSFPPGEGYVYIKRISSE